jgi:hypothetical protein
MSGFACPSDRLGVDCAFAVNADMITRLHKMNKYGFFIA